MRICPWGKLPACLFRQIRKLEAYATVGNHIEMPKFRNTQGLTLMVALVVLAGAAAADPTDERFLDGLRTSRLFSLAETYCRDRLAQTDLGPADRADLVIELSRTHAQHALNT